jgi:thymidylate synthase
MEHIENGKLNNDFRTCLARLMESGMTTHPRGTTTKEHLNYNISLFNPRNRIVNFPDRKTNLKYLLGEFIWYVSGNPDPVGILPYAKFWDGIRNSGGHALYVTGDVNSNYGTRLFGHSTLPAFTTKASTLSKPEPISQWNETVALLQKDKDTRQAIMNIHVPSDRHEGNKDVPCTLTLHWFIRENKLQLIVNMRSNDVILGFTNDVFQFTMLQECMAVQLRETYPDLELGAYYHNAGSMHIYDRHFAMAEKIIADERTLELSMAPMDVFNDTILTGLVGVETAWQNWLQSEVNQDESFNFRDVPAFDLLTPYWQNLVLMCFGEDEEAMHDVFGIDHDHT